MELRFVEAGQGGTIGNWGKFAIGRFTVQEWRQPSAAPETDERSLIAGRGWSARHYLVIDLQTGEAAMFRPGGLASADLHKHQIWVCPMFEPMLGWLYARARADPDGWFDELPYWTELPDAEFSFYGYRRPGLGRHKLRQRAWRTRVHRTRRRNR